jgi:hypothetical protein
MTNSKIFTRKKIESEGFKFINVLKYSEIFHKKVILYFIDASETADISTLEFAYYINESKGLHLYIVLDPYRNNPIYIIHDFGRKLRHISYILDGKILKDLI